jgi:hypothetical protein
MPWFIKISGDNEIVNFSEDFRFSREPDLKNIMVKKININTFFSFAMTRIEMNNMYCISL